MFVVVMGVSGSGKSTVGAALASELDVVFLDADDLHPDVNVAKMRAGTPLTDEDRWPWLDAVGKEAAAILVAAGGVVVACSALRRSYRDVLRLYGATDFVHLTGDRALLAARMRAREDHWMDVRMLEGQLAALEPPEDEPDVVELDVALPPDRLVTLALERVVGPPG